MEQITDMIKDYVPFGPEWEKAARRMNKDYLIHMIKKMGQEIASLEQQLSKTIEPDTK